MKKLRELKEQELGEFEKLIDACEGALPWKNVKSNLLLDFSQAITNIAEKSFEAGARYESPHFDEKARKQFFG